ENRDSYALRFKYFASVEGFHLVYGVGITRDLSIPSHEAAGSNLIVWNFSTCDSDVIAQWQVLGASSNCEPGKGLVLTPHNADSQMVNPSVNIDLNSGSTQF